MKRTILTAGLLFAALAASAKGADTILDKDPVGIYVTIVSVVTVLSALIVLFLLIQLFAKVMVKSAQKKAAKSKTRGILVDDMKVSVPAGCDSVVNGEIIAAIALAVKLNKAEMHDRESDVITINKVARVYSPWSSKIHGLTPLPEKGRPVHGGVQPPDPCGSVPGDPAMITLGITGRSGCGKSTVTAVFAAHGVPLVDADQISREILLPGSPLLPVLAQRFGADILYADGSLNRRLLADRAFAAPEGKDALDSLVLPEIIRRVCRLKQAAREAGAPLFVIDGAVIVGTDAEKECDHLCVVTAPFATSVARIAARDGIAPEMAARRLNAQTPEEVLLARADLVLRNDADLASLEAAAAALCEQLQAEGARKGGADTSL